MNKHVLLTIIAILLYSFGISQTFIGKEAKSEISVSKEIHKNIKTQQIDYILFDQNSNITLENLEEWVIRQFKLSDNISLQEINRMTDINDQLHIRYKLSVDNFQIHDAMIIAHSQEGRLLSINGIIQKAAQGNYSASISESQALEFAKTEINANIYIWELPSEEAFIKKLENNPEATFFPKARFEIIKNKKNNEYRLAYIFDIYAQEPMSRQDVYVDAINGEILFINKKIHHSNANGTATTKYSGNQNITTDSYNSTFRLRETSRGLGIETYNLSNATTYGNATDFTDSDNNWTTVNAQQDEIATDAHWGMEMTYDYYFNKHNRNSIDGSGFKLISFVHYDNNYANAFWNGQYMTFGDGDASVGPLVALDIVGHEISHGLTSNTANLDYQDESGALNESYSDIFGTAIEFYAKPNTANWLMGEDIGSAFRSMSDPNSKGDPDTYLGTNYYVGTADNGGVHTNSGVLNYIFYLMSDGATGTNDIGDSFNVNGVSIDTAAAIAFRTLTVYLTNTSNYADARFYFIKSAIDLYGPCSSPVRTTTNAFYAAGIGGQYVAGVHANFDAEIKEFCQPSATVRFDNLSNNGITFLWNFGDGNTSTDYEPTHTYTSFGIFPVSLSIDGGSCGIDTKMLDNFISIDTANPCITFMPTVGNQVITSCSGVLYDDGGTGEYSNNTNVTTTISPLGASKVTLTFTQFDFEPGYDYLKIYDGPSSSSPLIGSYDGTSLPNGGIVASTNSSITIVQQTDQLLSEEGFTASWQCEFAAAPPISYFMADDSLNCSGVVNFTNQSVNGPTSYSWDFGDGNSSNLASPSHTYLQNGTYTVSLSTTNSYGNHQIVKSNYITINKPTTPFAPSVASCTPGIFTLYAGGNGDAQWYNSQSATNQIATGSNFTTPNLNQSTSYWVENTISHTSKIGGKLANTSSGGNLNYEHSLIFDVYKTSILKSVKVNAVTAGSRTIKLSMANGTLLDSKTVNVVSGWNTVVLDFDLPIGNGLMLTGKDLHRNNSGVSYPYSIGNIVNITKSTAGTDPLSYYYYFYEWEVQEKSCASDRKEVTVFINSNIPTASFSNVINDPYVNFTNTSVNTGITNWSFGDQLTSTIENPQHLYLTNGTYNVKLVVDNGCGIDSITETITISQATSINNIEKDDNIKLYPNPNNGEFSIEFDGKMKYTEFEIINSIGAIIYRSNIQKNETIINANIRNFGSGMYLIRFKSVDRISNMKFIKK